MEHTISSLLQEASNVVNGTYDIEPLSVENRAGKFSVHKAGKTNLKKTWRKPTDKPKRPLSAYNLFFQHEREKIITNNPEVTLEETLIKISNTPKPKKRRHRKSHGMIGFADLARTIAEKWKSLEAGDKTIYESKAGEEKQRYRKQLEAWSKAREEKAKEDQKKSPLELARVEVVYDDQDPLSAVCQKLPETSSNSKSGLSPESLSSFMVGSVGYRPSQQQPNDLRDYFKMTQQTIEMARASLSLPLFAGIGVNQVNAKQQMPFEPTKFSPLSGADLLLTSSSSNNDPFQQGSLSASMLAAGMGRMGH